MIRSEGFLAFLEIIDTLIAELNLDYSDIQKMNIQYEHIKKEDEILDSMESEIVEKSDSDKLSLETGDQKPRKKEEKKLTIEYFGTDLIIGREKEIDQVIYTLLRKTKNNPLLIGEAGVGKTAIVEGLVQRINAKQVPEKLIGKKVFLLDM